MASSRPMLVGIDSWFPISISSMSWWTISSSFCSLWLEFIDNYWLDALDQASLCKFTTRFLIVLHFASRMASWCLTLTRILIIDIIWEIRYCSLSWTLEVIEKIGVPLLCVISSWDWRFLHNCHKSQWSIIVNPKQEGKSRRESCNLTIR